VRLLTFDTTDEAVSYLADKEKAQRWNSFVDWLERALELCGETFVLLALGFVGGSAIYAVLRVFVWAVTGR
jgi:hypothetical protein